jgi:tetratricopeptide (TPR) repeat protein
MSCHGTAPFIGSEHAPRKSQPTSDCVRRGYWCRIEKHTYDFLGPTVYAYLDPRVRFIGLLMGLCFATCATAYSTIAFEVSQSPDLTESTGQAEQPAPAPAAPEIAPAERKYEVAKDLFGKIQELLRRRDFANALTLINQVLANESSNPELYILRASVQCRAGKMTLCLEDAVRAVDVDKEYAPSYRYRGMVRIESNQAREALPDCEFVIRLRPDQPLGYDCRGLARLALHDFSQAIADFDEALRKDSTFSFAHYNKGIAYALQNQQDTAIASFTAAIGLNDKHDDSFAQRGKARIANGDVENARADFAQALMLNGRNHTAAVGMQALQIGKALDALAGKK